MKFPWSRRAAIEEELRTHLQMAIQDRIARGESPDDAARNARREFGNELLVLETTRNAWGWVTLERLALEIRYVLRQLRRSPGFTFVAVFTLAVGLGGAIAAFSVVNSVLLEPLPYEAPDRLFSVLNLAPPGVANTYMMINPRHFHEWREHCKLCEDVGAATLATAGFTLTGYGEPERFPGLRVTYNFFRTLGVKPALGRDFNREEELPNDYHKVLIADSVWRSRFGADPSVIGRTVQINGESHVLIGVMPANLTLPRGKQWGGDSVAEGVPVIFRPVGMDVSQGTGAGNIGNFITVARLKPEVQGPQAASEFSSLIADFVRQFKLHTRPVLLPLHSTMVRESRASLWLLLGTAVAVLLIVCVNVGNLMLVRAAGRSREVGIRMSIGASRQQLFMLLLAEALILVLSGSVAGLGFAYSVLKGIVAWAPPGLARIDQIQMDGSALLFAIAAAALSVGLCGVLPAWRLARTDLQDALKAGSSITAPGGKVRFREIMVAVEVALSATLLLVGGLLVASFLRVLDAPTGIAMDHVVTQEVSLSGSKYADPNNRIGFIERVLDQLAAIPGVHSVGVTNQVPLRGENWTCDLRDLGTPGRDAVGVANYRFVNSDYWETLGIPFKAGRALEQADKTRAAVLSERAARVLWPGESAIGKRVGSCRGEALEVVGVVGDVRTGLEKEAPLTVYQPFYWMPDLGRQFFVVRTSIVPASTITAMRSVFRSLDPDLPLTRPATMPEIFDEALAARRFQLSLAVGFEGLGLILAGIGIYGVISFTVVQRTSELGIRLALGARASDVASMVLLQGMIPVFAGLLSGLALALLLGRFFASQLYGISPYDPGTVAAASVVLLIVAALACWVPARRAMLIDPVTAIRIE